MNIQFNSLPVDGPLRITSDYGPRDTGIKGASTFHPGNDLGRDFSKPKTNILAVMAGTIEKNEWNDYRGWFVIINHGNGIKTRAQHLESQCPIPVGTNVKAGQVIGVMGNSSNKKKLDIPVHLHFELIVDGKTVDPEPYLKNIKPEEEEEVAEKVYKTLDEIPTWGKKTIEKLISKGGITPTENSTATINDDEINITHSMLRIYVSLDKMGKL